MPPLYEMDDYDRCMDEFPNVTNTYCYTRTQIKPNATSDLWLYIQVNIVDIYYSQYIDAVEAFKVTIKNK